MTQIDLDIAKVKINQYALHTSSEPKYSGVARFPTHAGLLVVNSQHYSFITYKN